MPAPVMESPLTCNRKEVSGLGDQIFVHGYDIAESLFFRRWKSRLNGTDQRNGKGVLRKGQMPLIVFLKQVGIDEFIDPEIDDAF